MYPDRYESLGKSHVHVSHVTIGGRCSWGAYVCGLRLARGLVTNCFRLSPTWRGFFSLRPISWLPNAPFDPILPKKKITYTTMRLELNEKFNGGRWDDRKDESATQRKLQEGVNWYEMTYKLLNEIFIQQRRKGVIRFFFFYFVF